MGGILLAVFLVTSSKMKGGKPNVVDERPGGAATGLVMDTKTGELTDFSA
jgi:hypothetical protein